MSENLSSHLKVLESEVLKKINLASNKKELSDIEMDTLGKKGKLTDVLKGLGKATPEDRIIVGKMANKTKEKILEAIKFKLEKIMEDYYQSLAKTEFIDVTELIVSTEKTEATPLGNIHPLTQTQEDLGKIFTSMGFAIVDGPQVETDWYNFGALNFTDDHPAREMQDTFYTKDGNLLRTHTSSTQVRVMETTKPPFRIIVPGRVFRNEEVDASHEHTFYQMEGMIIDKEVSVANLIFVMKVFLRKIFDQNVKIRLRPGYFPFVEPGFELDISCQICDGVGCNVCKKTGWVEICPCGLVHPNVLKAGGLDPQEWQGAAFGLGVNRLVMMENGIEDIRYFQNPEPEFLSQF